MWFHLYLLSVCVIITSSYGFLFRSPKPTCPPPEEIKPCTCTSRGEVSVLCQGINESQVLQHTFSKNPNWNIERIHFDRCILDYLPSPVLRYDSLKKVNISTSTMVSLFKDAPSTTPEMDIYVHDTKIYRGLRWDFLKNSKVTGFGTFNTEIRSFGKDIKTNMPKGIKNMWFENSKTSSILNQAFQPFDNLDILVITGGSLKNITPDMFPINLKFLNLSHHKIDSLPEDMFKRFKQLFMFSFMGNPISTIDEKIFTPSGVTYYFNGCPIECNCDIKWITTSGKQSFKTFVGECAAPESFKGKSLKKLTPNDFAFCR